MSPRVAVLASMAIVSSALYSSDKTAAQDDGFSLLSDRYAAALTSGQNVSDAAEIRASLREDGSWPDIDYSSKVRSSWPAAVHVKPRLMTLAADWRVNGNRESLEAAHRALGFWLKHRFKNPNWWWNDIGVPMFVGYSALMMDGELTDEERRGVIELMTVNEPKFAKTGQNLAWMAGNRLRRGILARDEKLVRGGLADILGVVCLGQKEGIQSDWCFHQHGSQPQFGNYGLSFLSDQSRLACILAGSDFEYPREKLELVEKLASEGYSWICWKGMMDVSAMGRQLQKGSQRQKASTVERSFRDLEKTGWRRPSPRTGFRYFDKSAYAVYRTEGFMASVRASTPKIIGVETTINEDNTKGMCMADGALMTYVTGREYYDVFPLWDDWRMIPGVTAYLGKPVVRKDSRNRRDDISAAAEGRGGRFEFTFEREGLVAHKKWTFSPSGVVCEGSGITATDGNYEVVTCVEHAHAARNATVVYQKENESRFRNGNLVYTVFAPKEAIRFELAEREGDFKDFMRACHPTPAKGKVFSLRIVHGVKPTDASYRYTITVNKGPRTSPAEFFTKHLDTSIPALSSIPERVSAGDIAGAEKVFADYIRATLRPEVLNREWIDRKYTPEKLRKLKEKCEEIMDYRLSSCGMPHHFKDHKVAR